MCCVMYTDDCGNERCVDCEHDIDAEELVIVLRQDGASNVQIVEGNVE